MNLNSLVDSAIGARWLEYPLAYRREFTQPASIVSPPGLTQLQIEGRGSCFAFDGAPAQITGPGRLRLHGSDWSPPEKLIHFSRGLNGASINHSTIHNLWASGYSLIAHGINDGTEGFAMRDSLIEQYCSSGCGWVISNKNRYDDPTPSPRETATCSWHEFNVVDFCQWGGVIPTNPTANSPACVRIAGNAGSAVFRNCWFSSGGVPAITMIDTADETFPNGGGTWNQPSGIIVEDCEAESQCQKIMLLNYDSSKIEISESIDTKIYRRISDRQEILTLRGCSVRRFDVIIM